MSFKKMLSLSRGEPIAHGLDKNGKKVLTINITPEQSEPDIMADHIESTVNDHDIQKVARILRLLIIETKQLRKFINDVRTKSLNKNGLSEEEKQKIFNNLTDRIQLAVTELRKIAKNNLKTHILFDQHDEVKRVVPLIGGQQKPFDRSLFICGPSGSGKTFLAKDIMKNDLRNRPIVIFSKIDDDESLKELKKLRLTSQPFGDEKGKERVIKIRLKTDDDLLNLPSNEELKNTICFFDDVDSFPSDYASFLSEYRSSLLECGRHHNITILSTSHFLYNYCRTRTLLNECECISLFPHSNKRDARRFLSDRMGLNNQTETPRILQEAMESGRSLTCRLSAPNCIIHEKGVILLS